MHLGDRTVHWAAILCPIFAALALVMLLASIYSDGWHGNPVATDQQRQGTRLLVMFALLGGYFRFEENRRIRTQ